MKSKRLTAAAIVLCAALGLGAVGLGSTASATAGAGAGQKATVQDTVVVIPFDGRIVTVRREGRLTQATISRAVPGDLVSLTDRDGRVWPAIVPPGGTTASTPWVVDAVRGNARTVEGRQLFFPIPGAAPTS